MTVQVAIPAMRRINHRVDDLAYASDVGIDGLTTVEIPPVPTADPNSILAAQSIAVAGTAVPIATFDPESLGRYGRTVQVVASGAAVSTVTLHGYDYLGQAIAETLTLAGAVPVESVKAYKDISHIDFGATAGTTINVGTGLSSGVPYKVLDTVLEHELVDGAPPVAAGALVAGVDTQTLTSSDPRGLYTPGDVFNNTRTYKFTCVVDRDNLHGSAHVIA